MSAELFDHPFDVFVLGLVPHQANVLPRNIHRRNVLLTLVRTVFLYVLLLLCRGWLFYSILALHLHFVLDLRHLGSYSQVLQVFLYPENDSDRLQTSLAHSLELFLLQNAVRHPYYNLGHFVFEPLRDN